MIAPPPLVRATVPPALVRKQTSHRHYSAKVLRELRTPLDPAHARVVVRSYP